LLLAERANELRRLAKLVERDFIFFCLWLGRMAQISMAILDVETARDLKKQKIIICRP